MHFRLRSFLRIPTDAKISIKSRDFCLTSTLADVSLGGFFLLSEELLPVGIGDIFKLNVYLPSDSDDACIAVNGTAVRIDANGIAFRFIETDSDTLRRLFSFIYPGHSLQH